MDSNRILSSGCFGFICGSSPRRRMRTPRWAAAFSSAMTSSVSMSFPSSSSLETACEALASARTSTCFKDVSCVASSGQRGCSRKPGVAELEVLCLAKCAPAHIQVPSVSKIRLSDRF